jgi:DNA polymerase
MKTLSIDVETFSATSLPEHGVYRYAEDEEFEILLFGYSVDGGEVHVVDFTAGEELPPEIMDAIWDPAVEKHAWNANFERTTIGAYFGQYCPPAQWFDPMILAASCGLPATLEAAGAALGLSEDQAKMKIGKQLIREFSIPCKPTKKNGMRTRNMPEDDPENWAIYKEYNKRDVETEMTICDRLLKWRPSRSEHKLWCLDQIINDLGIGVDVKMAENAIRIGDDYKERLIVMAQGISGLVNPASTAQVKMWLQEQEGLTVPSLNKKVIADVVAQLSSENAKRFMELRKEFSKSSTKKYEAIARSVCKDGHIHGTFQFAGAGRTGRWAGRLVQLQNLPQNHMEDLDSARWLVKEGDDATFNAVYPDVASTLSELIRTALIPEVGHRFLVADFSAIEARVIAWIANEQWRLDTFVAGGDIYCASASQMFKVPVVKHGENGHLRQKGKIAELALGYGGGVNALKAFGADKSMTEEEMVQTVDLWRGSSPHICSLWKSLEKAAIKCVVRKSPAISSVGGILFEYEDGVLWMTLPSGRRIAYWGAMYLEGSKGMGKTLSYMGVNQTTRKWERIETWGGKLTENLVQATARDCLKEAMLRLSDAGFDIRAHVHDEVIITEPIGGRDVAEVCEIMGRNASWNEGLPLRADGYETPYYKKD